MILRVRVVSVGHVHSACDAQVWTVLSLMTSRRDSVCHGFQAILKVSKGKYKQLRRYHRSFHPDRRVTLRKERGPLLRKA